MDPVRLIPALSVLAKPEPEADQIEALVQLGFTLAEAHRVVAFVPSALARPLLERLGISSFAPVASVPAGEGSWVDADLERQPEYVAALALARDHWRSGGLDRALYEAIVRSTSEVRAVDNALNAGADVKGSAVALALNNGACAPFIVR